MVSSTSPATVRSKAGAIFRVTSGNFLEQFDFFLFGFYATYIAHTFFPASSEFASLMMTFAVFGAGFLMRPIGAIVLGAYIDKVGRRKGLIVTLSIMAAGTFLIVLIPSYQSIGLWAPLLVLIGRLLQGFSAGAELGGVSVYLAEIATPGRKGFYTSWQSGSQQVAIMIAAAMGGKPFTYPAGVFVHNDEFKHILMAMETVITKEGVSYKNVQGTAGERQKLTESYEHLCKLRDEVIAMGILPPVGEWGRLNSHLK